MKASDPSKTPVISKHNISCSNDTLIRPCFLTPLKIPQLEFHFQLISTVQEMKKDDVIDVLAIIEQFGDVQEKRLSNGSPGRCRGVWIVDQSKAKVKLLTKYLHIRRQGLILEIRITELVKIQSSEPKFLRNLTRQSNILIYIKLINFRRSNFQILLFVWGSNADNFQTNRPGDVIAVKRAKIKNYAKLNLDSSCLSSSTFKVRKLIPFLVIFIPFSNFKLPCEVFQCRIDSDKKLGH